MSGVVWYISKYIRPSTPDSVGARGFMIMNELAEKGYKILVITSDSNHIAASYLPNLKSSYFVDQVNKMQICWIRVLKYKGAKSFRRILSWLHFEWRLWRLPKNQFSKPDVVVVSSLSIFTILNGILLRARYKCRLVFEVRDIWPLTLVEHGGFSRYNPFILVLAYIEKLGYQKADAIVGTMPNLSEHVTDVLGCNKPTFCIPMGVNGELPKVDIGISKSFRNKYIPKDKFIVAHVGTIGISNALDTLFKCALEMKKTEEIHFLVVGDGGLLSRYKSEYSCLSNITFAPKVLKSEVPSVLYLCDLLYFSAHCSKVWQFGQSLNKAVDYMQSGKPIVASYSGYPSMINEARCGSFVPTGNVGELRNEIVRYFSMKEDTRQKIGVRGQQWILKNRTFKKLANDYLKILFPQSTSC